MAHAPPHPPDGSGAGARGGPGALYGFSDFDFGSFQDMTGQTHASSTMPMGDAGNALMLDSTMLDSFTDMPIDFDPIDGNAMAGFGPAGLDPAATNAAAENPPVAGPIDNSADVAAVAAVAAAENQFNITANNVPGAGPLPVASFGQAGTAGGGTGGSGGSTALTEFTKRRNWPAKVIEEVRDLVHILDADGRVKYSSPSVTALLGYAPEDVQDRLLKDLIHPGDQGVFVSELNESIASGASMRIFYRMRKSDQSYVVLEATGHAHIAAAKYAPNPNNQSPFCQAVFVMARPYPTKNAGLLDSFLEHKVENERLKRRIAELRMEEDAENDEAHRDWLQRRESDISQSGSLSRTSASASADGSRTERANASAAALNGPLTRENLEGAFSNGNRPDSLRDKMVRYEGAYTDTIEMLTGLRYVEGERSRGITTGNASPTLIKGDAGIAIPVDRDPRTGEKKKKLKASEEYVCTDCGMVPLPSLSPSHVRTLSSPGTKTDKDQIGTLDSPEWRKGPNGPKTLCNACGLRWAKKEKKKNTGNSHAPP
ncbi:cutinase palindrome-binding protein [Geosmithia morbida]|uniref:Cutinase palindrome-binding protein n=1 Tax=Geosmithia morbida TaxID=1094350 RepID=A0A9P4Z1S1_9HYPO|nr:cutinase palindrome-binding protein [Geosmithia morbida]KAF4125054.1 cutinase palindrome-binding protein [Geosmithia morbida]